MRSIIDVHYYVHPSHVLSILNVGGDYPASLPRSACTLTFSQNTFELLKN